MNGGIAKLLLSEKPSNSSLMGSGLLFPEFTLLSDMSYCYFQLAQNEIL